MADALQLTVEEVTSASKELDSISEEVLELSTNMYNEIKALEQYQEFKTIIASGEYFEKIDNLSKEVPKYASNVKAFSDFLINNVIKDYEQTDAEGKTDIEEKLGQSIDELNNSGQLGESVDLSKISTTAQDALNGNFLDSSKLSKSAFQDGELEFKVREDGSVQILKNGTILGYTTQEGISGSTDTGAVGAIEQPDSTPAVNPITEGSIAATIATATSLGTGVSQSPQIGTPIAAKTMDQLSGYTGELHTKAKASEEIKNSSGNITTGHQTYTIVPDSQYTKSPGTISESDYNLLVAQVAGESANSKDDMLGVTCTILNRLEAGGGYGESVHEVLNKGYLPWGESYRGYVESGKTYSTLGGIAQSNGSKLASAAEQAKLEQVKAAVNDALGGVRNIEDNVYYYSGNGKYNKFSDIV